MMTSAASSLVETKPVPKPHAVCIPCPYQSHITALLSLAKLLHHRGFHITFVNTEFNHKRILKSRGPDSLNGLPDFRFEAIPDGLPPSDTRQDIPNVIKAIKSNLLSPFMDLITQKLMNPCEVPPVTCIVADMFVSCSYAAGEQLGVPVVSYCTISACSLLACYQFPSLKEKGFVPLQDPHCYPNGYLDTVVDGMPGMNKIRLRDLPSFPRSTDPDDYTFNFIGDEVQEASKRSSAVMMNTFDELEGTVLEALASSFPPIYSIGPIHLLLNQVPKQNPVMSIESNLWEEEVECLGWLDSKEPKSVVYVNFGSITVMSKEQLLEFAWGLAESGCNILWVIRPELVIGSESTSSLGPELEEAARGRFFIANWCPQVQVLDHPSVGLFLTHSGWNSTLESLCSGVPMICWPFLGDQPTNCRYSCVEWGIGKEIEKDARRDDVKRVVREVMEGEEGMKERVMEWSRAAHAAVAPNGSSYKNLDRIEKMVVHVG